MAVVITQHIRPMRGGAQGHLMLGSDDELYVVKFQNNPQATRVLANEYLATRLAEKVGLSVPRCEVVEVTPWLIDSTTELRMRHTGSSEKCKAGLQFGSRFAGGLIPGQVVDYLAEAQLAEVKNLVEFAGMLLIDKWTSNANGRQAVFVRRGRERRYGAFFIDQGYCFGASEWLFRDVPLRGVYPRNAVYTRVTGWHDFEPWLTRVEGMEEAGIWEIAEAVPPEWYGGDLGDMERLVHELIRRRGRVRELVEEFRKSDRDPFPAWGKGWQEVPGGERVSSRVMDVGRIQ